jgi:DNA-binding transcriptional MerR regulator
MSDYFLISEVSRETGLSPPTIRYYEQIGLLSPPVRGENGYRRYSPDDLEQLLFVKRARLLDLSLVEIGEIMTHAVCGECGPLQQRLFSLLADKIAEVEEKINHLTALKADLETYHQTLALHLPITREDSQHAYSSFCSCLENGA